jgi:hypothetical protein
MNLAQIVQERGDRDASLSLVEEAIATLDKVLEAQPRDAMAQMFLLGALRGRAERLLTRGRAAEALADWDRALPLASTSEARNQIAVEQMLARVYTVSPAQAASEVEALTASLGPKDGEARFSMALVHDQLAKLAAADPELSTREKERQIDICASRAMAALAQAREQGIFQNPYRLNTLRNSELFSTLRRRPEFQLLLMDLAMPVSPFAPAR